MSSLDEFPVVIIVRARCIRKLYPLIIEILVKVEKKRYTGKWDKGNCNVTYGGKEICYTLHQNAAVRIARVGKWPLTHRVR